MSRNLKALGLTLLAICAMGAVAAQGASAVNHEFHADGPIAGITGSNVEGKPDKFQVGAAGTVECAKTDLEATQEGTKVTDTTYKADTLTVIPRYTECKFGGQPATVNFNHCAYIFFSDTTGGTEAEKEHANVELECAPDPAGGSTKVEIHTSVCTITILPQVIPHAVSYLNEPTSAVKILSTAKNVVTGKSRNTAAQPVNGCLTFPTGAIGTYTGEATVKCSEDEGSKQEGTAKTTPVTKHGKTTDCSVNGAPNA